MRRCLQQRWLLQRALESNARGARYRNRDRLQQASLGRDGAVNLNFTRFSRASGVGFLSGDGLYVVRLLKG